MRPWPATGETVWQVSNEGGGAPQWSLNGRELFYQAGNRLMGVEVLPGPTFTLGRRREVMSLSGFTDWSVAPNGRFLLLRRHAGAGA